MAELLRSVWDEPRPPVRLWRDWVLVTDSWATVQPRSGSTWTASRPLGTLAGPGVDDPLAVVVNRLDQRSGDDDLYDDPRR